MSSNEFEPALAGYNNEFWDEESSLLADKRGSRKKLWLLLGLVVLVGLAGGVSMMNGNSDHVGRVKNVVMSKLSNSKKVLQAYVGPNCPDGEYGASGACHPCPMGYSCKGNIKTICPKGTYQSKTGQAACVPAACGHFVPAAGGTAQETCRPGTYSKVGAFECIPTPVGTFTLAGACDPVKCPKGEYQDCDGQKECRKVPCGHFVDKLGQTQITPCPAGTYQPAEGQSSCIPVGQGEYAGVGYCQKRTCIPGQFQGQTKQDKCTDADCGKYVPAGGSNNQVVCPHGEWQPDPGQSMCLAIPNGYIAVMNKCKIECCKAGTFRAPDFTCHPAPCGWFVKDDCASAPTKCPPGEYTDGPGASGCVKAPKGSIPNPDHCKTQQCKPGTYQNEIGQTSCKEAQCGEKAPSPGMIDPIKCPPGTFQNLVKQLVCKPCPMGSANNIAGQCICPDCLAGTYQPNTGKTTCIDSPCGKYVPGTGATAPIDCPPGQYQPLTGQDSCLKAPKGKFAIGGTCLPDICVPGTFTDAVEQVKCKDAPCGYFVGGAGAISATPCVPGEYQPLIGQTTCLATPTGSYTDKPGQCDETLCPQGTYQPKTGQTMCLDTDCGHYVSIVGSANQNKCGAGRYQPNKRQTSCILADKGNFVGSDGKCGQQPCPEGKYTDCKGQSKCSTAPCGSYVSGTGKTAIALCAAGTYQDVAGQGSCKTVAAGFFAGVGFCAPEPCNPGTYQNQAGQGSCKPASCGNFVESEGRKSETPCPSSYYQPLPKQVGCLPTTHQLAPLPGTCQKGSVANGLFYPGPSAMNFASAKKYCADNGDQLASVYSASENAEFLSVCKPNPHCYLGGSDAAKEGTWVWVDGTQFYIKGVGPVAGRYQNWNGGEPNNAGGSENCVATLTDGKWNDVPCTLNFPFVCERRPTPPVWVLIYRQKVSNGYFAKSVLTSGTFGTASGTGNYLNLVDISKYNVNGGDYEFKMRWPGATFNKDQIWKQTSNPWLKKSKGVIGYKAVSAPYSQNMWGGLEYGGTYSVLDGTVNHNNWYYSVASFQEWHGGIPGPGSQPSPPLPAGVSEAELYVKRPSGPYCSLVTGYDMPHNDIWHGSVASVQACQQKCLSNANCVCYAADFPSGKLCWLKSKCPVPMGVSANRQTGFCFN